MASTVSQRLLAVWIIFSALFLFTIGFMIAALSTSDWISINPNYSNSFSYASPYGFSVPVNASSFAFDGSIRNIVTGLTSVRTYLNPIPPSNALNLQGDDYSKVGCGLCFIVEVSNQKTFDPTLWNFYNSWCNFMKHLWFAAGFYITLEIMSLASVVCVLVLIGLVFKGMYHPKLIYLASGSVVVCHYLAILVWIGLANARFSDNDCTDLYNTDQSAPKVCAKSGPRLGVFILIYLPFVVVPFIVFVWYMNKKYGLGKGKEVKPDVVNSAREVASKNEGTIRNQGDVNLEEQDN